MEWKTKRGFFKFSKWGVLKVTGLALTVGFAFNYTKNEIVNEIEHIHDHSTADSVLVRQSVDALVDSLNAVVERISVRVGMESTVRDTLIFTYRDSLVVTVRDSIVLVPIFETTFRESTLWVIDTLEVTVEEDPPSAWELFGPGPRVSL